MGVDVEDLKKKLEATSKENEALKQEVRARAGERAGEPTSGGR